MTSFYQKPILNNVMLHIPRNKDSRPSLDIFLNLQHSLYIRFIIVNIENFVRIFGLNPEENKYLGLRKTFKQFREYEKKNCILSGRVL